MREAVTKALVVVACSLLCGCDGLRVAIIVTGPSTVVVSSADQASITRNQATRDPASERLCAAARPSSTTTQEIPATSPEGCNTSADPARNTPEPAVQ
jgi:hypothetical protein